MALLSPRRTAIIFSLLITIYLALSFYQPTAPYIPHSIALNIDFRQSFEQTYQRLTSNTHQPPQLQPNASVSDSSQDQTSKPESQALQERLGPGVPKPPGSAYSRALVIPHTTTEDISWLALVNRTAFPDLTIYPYVVNPPPSSLDSSTTNPSNENALWPHSLTSPKNKGHEVMVYLTFLIDHYDSLPDITIFMHSHRHAWHNNDLLDFDAYQHIARLSSAHVIRQGYFNLRCQWEPGCPSWIHPLEPNEVYERQEQIAFTKAYRELFPGEPIPEDLAQPCCGQFALSKERIYAAAPIQKLVWWRDWLLKTKLTDYVSGRVWEYSWQYVFTGRGVVCPGTRGCYCDAYRVCFEDEDRFQGWYKARFELKGVKEELDRILQGKQEDQEGRGTYLVDLAKALKSEMEEGFSEAARRGEDPGIRPADGWETDGEEVDKET